MSDILDDLKGFLFGSGALKKAAGDAKSSDASSDSSPSQDTSYVQQAIKSTKNLPNPAAGTPAPPTKAAPKAKVPKAADALSTPGKGAR